MDGFEQTMYWLLAGSKGASNRLKIIEFLDKKPGNQNELSKKIGLNYKTVQHHIDLLVENNLLVKKGDKYGQVYFLSPQLHEKLELFKKLLEESNMLGENSNEKK
jgi:predicted transcriptional regulator